MTEKPALEPERDIVVIGHYGYGNLGDDLLAHYVLSRVCLAVSPNRVVVGTPSGSYLERWFPGVKCVPLQRIFRHQSDVPEKAVLGGGGLFFAFPPANLTSLWGLTRSTTYRLWHALGLSGWHRTRKYAFCVGVGPLAGFGSRLVTRGFLDPFEEISVRDAESKGLLSELGIDHARLVVDASVGFANMTSPRPVKSTRTAGFVIRSWPYYPDVSAFLNRLIAAARVLRINGWEVEFVSFEAGDEYIERKLKALGEDLRTWDPETETIQQFCDHLSGYRVMVTMRAHGVFLGSFVGATPVAVELEPKLRQAAQACGFEDFLVSVVSSTAGIVETVERAASDERRKRDWNRELRALNAESDSLSLWLRD